MADQIDLASVVSRVRKNWNTNNASKGRDGSDDYSLSRQLGDRTAQDSYNAAASSQPSPDLAFPTLQSGAFSK